MIPVNLIVAGGSCKTVPSARSTDWNLYHGLKPADSASTGHGRSIALTVQSGGWILSRSSPSSPDCRQPSPPASANNSRILGVNAWPCRFAAQSSGRASCHAVSSLPSTIMHQATAALIDVLSALRGSRWPRPPRGISSGSTMIIVPARRLAAGRVGFLPCGGTASVCDRHRWATRWILWPSIQPQFAQVSAVVFLDLRRAIGPTAMLPCRPERYAKPHCAFDPFLPWFVGVSRQR